MYDLSNCKKGDRLITLSGELIIFDRHLKEFRSYPTQEDPFLEYILKTPSGEELSYTKDGCYNSDESEHPWDILGFYTKDLAYNTINNKIEILRNNLLESLSELDKIQSALNVPDSQYGRKLKPQKLTKLSKKFKG